MWVDNLCGEVAIYTCAVFARIYVKDKDKVARVPKLSPGPCRHIGGVEI
jgi:hypothetical protein